MITENQNCYKTHITRLHWAAIIAGAFVGVGLTFLLNMYSIAIGLSAYSSSPDGATAFTIGGFLGLLIGVIVSMGAAGFIAGYLGRFYNCYCHAGVVYGFITWSLALMLNVLLIMPMTHYVSFYQENLNPALAPTQVSAADLNVAVTSQQNAPAPKNENANPKHLAAGGWVLFILFFLGAVSSCIGAVYGMRCKKEEEGSVAPPMS